MNTWTCLTHEVYVETARRFLSGDRSDSPHRARLITWPRTEKHVQNAPHLTPWSAIGVSPIYRRIFRKTSWIGASDVHAIACWVGACSAGICQVQGISGLENGVYDSAEPLRSDIGSSRARRSQVSSCHRWPLHHFGDIQSSALPLAHQVDVVVGHSLWGGDFIFCKSRCPNETKRLRNEQLERRL